MISMAARLHSRKILFYSRNGVKGLKIKKNTCAITGARLPILLQSIVPQHRDGHARAAPIAWGFGARAPRLAVSLKS